MSIIRALQFRRQFFASHSTSAFPQGFNDVDIFVRFLVERIEKPAEFTTHLCVLTEEQAIDILYQALVMVKQTQVIRNPTKHHIGLEYHLSIPDKMMVFEVSFGFLEGKRMNR